MNRFDKVVVFRCLQEHHLRQILELELQAVQERVMIVRSFANCPRPHHSSTLSSLYFQQLTNGSVIALFSGARFEPERGQMLRIERAANGEVVLTVSGRMDDENLNVLKNLIDSEAP